MLDCAEWIPSVQSPTGDVLHLRVTGEGGVDAEVTRHLPAAWGENLPQDEEMVHSLDGNF